MQVLALTSRVWCWSHHSRHWWSRQLQVGKYWHEPQQREQASSMIRKKSHHNLGLRGCVPFDWNWAGSWSCFCGLTGESLGASMNKIGSLRPCEIGAFTVPLLTYCLISLDHRGREWVSALLTQYSFLTFRKYKVAQVSAVKSPNDFPWSLITLEYDSLSECRF